MHGVPSSIISNGNGLMEKGRFEMTRYNSLVLVGPGDLEVTAFDETERYLWKLETEIPTGFSSILSLLAHRKECLSLLNFYVG